MKWEEVIAAAAAAGLNEGQAHNAALWLTRDDGKPTPEECQAHFAKVLARKPRRRLSDDLKFLTTPEEDFRS
jgi:hypothetical protein